MWWLCLAGENGDDRAELSAEELTRANAFLTRELRIRFVAAHAMMRMVLARYLDWEPARLRILSKGGPGTKPRLESAPGLFFNLARSGGSALLAISDHEVGVDLERDKPGVPERELADVALSPGERTHRDQDLLQVWTRKEAALKAHGVGLALDPRDLTVVQPAEGSWRLVEAAEIPKSWVRDLPTPKGYRGALALMEPLPTVCFRLLGKRSHATRRPN